MLVLKVCSEVLLTSRDWHVTGLFWTGDDELLLLLCLVLLLHIHLVIIRITLLLLLISLLIVFNLKYALLGKSARPILHILLHHLGPLQHLQPNNRLILYRLNRNVTLDLFTHLIFLSHILFTIHTSTRHQLIPQHIIYLLRTLMLYLLTHHGLHPRR